ncbi:hypothetical protein TCSYLVIO_004026 [Trypanosoma cruzi]|nr:hypothetical protein TCSYLVIO_004026 [Trypanosoma cruzi]
MSLCYKSRGLLFKCVFVLMAVYLCFFVPWPEHNANKQGTRSTQIHQAAHGLGARINGSQGFQLGWSGRTCGPGARLIHKSLLSRCRTFANKRGSVSLAFCDKILRPGPPPCGFFVGGKFKQPLRLLGLSELKQLRGDGRFEACASRRMYDGVQSNSTLHAVDVGDGSSFAFEVRPAFCPSYRYFSPLEALSILHHASIGRNGHGIIVTGDSMLRQLLLRLMFFLRGEEVFAEHEFHCDALYVVYEDRDELILSFTCAYAALIETYFPGYQGHMKNKTSCAHFLQSERVVAIFLYLWDPLVNDFREDAFRIRSPPVHLASFMYWWQRGEERLGGLTRYFHRLRSRMVSDKKAFGIPATKYVFFTTPRTEALPSFLFPDDLRLERNAFAWKNLQSMEEELDTGGFGTAMMSLVDFAALADLRRISRTDDLIHFMCTWRPKSPRKVSSMKTAHVTCQDPVNLAVVQWTLHLLWTGL